ncbi:hypothetical protein M9Y10_027505 [Tritrichomonas musculus]|uniref:Serine/threonine-protein phosphatase n=1 Tax=Tritrichomonas musculus TaxID=1915356 RepID=A0ABR2H6C9_9EUKA
MEKSAREKHYDIIFNYFSKVFSIDVNEYASKRKKLHLPKIPCKILLELLNDASAIFESEPIILRTESPLVVVGDIHGHILDLFRILKTIGHSSVHINNQNSNQNVNNAKGATECSCDNSKKKSHRSQGKIQNSNSLDYNNVKRLTLLKRNNLLDFTESNDISENITSSNETHIKYIFLGDFVDRGQFSFETILLVLTMKILWPTDILIVRGNHEFKEIYSQGFQSFGNELREIYQNSSEEVIDAFASCFSYIPLAAIVDNKTICLHGGVGSSLKNGSFELIQSEGIRPIHDFSNNVISDILWSDPSEYILNFQPSSRGSGSLFGIDALDQFLSNSGLKCMIRGHQCIEGGVSSLWDDKCFTVFSASNYCGAFNNKTGIIKVNIDGYQIQVFEPIPALSRSSAVFDDFNKLEGTLLADLNCLPSIQGGNMTPNNSKSPSSLNPKPRFENRSKSQLTSKTSSENRGGINVNINVGIASPLCKKNLEKDKILTPQPRNMRPSRLRNHHSFSIQPLKRGPLD